MEALQNSPELVVWTDPDCLDQAKTEFAGFEASFRNIARPHTDFGKDDVFVFYVYEARAQDRWEKLFELCRKTKPEGAVFYSPHHSSESAFHLGWIAGKYQLRNAEWASSFRHVRQLLRNWRIVQTSAADRKFDIVSARKRLGLTQEEMASALGIATRTLQNWERGLATGQMDKKVRDVSELLSMMDEFVIAPRESEWLKTPLEALRSRAPIDLIKEGKLRDVIVEFHRLREGQPL